jgi:hypothetical protein
VGMLTRMALTPKDILDTAIEQGRKVVKAGAGIGKRLRREEDDAEVAPTPSASRAGGAKTGAATPGTTRTERARAAGARKPASKSSRAKSSAGKAGASKSAGDTAKPTPRSKGRTTTRTAASKAAASSADEVKKGAKS